MDAQGCGLTGLTQLGDQLKAVGATFDLSEWCDDQSGRSSLNVCDSAEDLLNVITSLFDNRLTLEFEGKLTELGGYDRDDVDVYFEWREVGDSSFEETDSIIPGSSGDPFSIGPDLRDLIRGTTYEYRAVAAVDGEVVDRGKLKDFTFGPGGGEEQEVSVETLEPAVTGTTATFTGRLTELEGYSSVDVYFEWGEGGEGLSRTTDSGTRIEALVPFTNTEISLDRDTTYEYRAVAAVDGEVVDRGAVVEFETGLFIH